MKNIIAIISWNFCLLHCIAAFAEEAPIKVLSFNILQGGNNAANVGFFEKDYQGSRLRVIADVIKQTEANLVGIQENNREGKLLNLLGDKWQQQGSIYSKFPLEKIYDNGTLTVCKVQVTPQKSLIMANCHWRPYPYGPYILQEWIRDKKLPSDPQQLAKQVLAASNKQQGRNGYDETTNKIKPWIDANETVILTGDFNEPSPLDWTLQTKQQGLDRWVENPTETPLRFVVAWEGISHLMKLGLKDAYRVVHPDATKKPGITWTPAYPKETQGRRDYGEQVLDRIDMIHYVGSIEPQTAQVVGESSKWVDRVYAGRWPSDHRAVLANFILKESSKRD